MRFSRHTVNANTVDHVNGCERSGRPTASASDVDRLRQAFLGQMNQVRNQVTGVYG